MIASGIPYCEDYEFHDYSGEHQVTLFDDGEKKTVLTINNNDRSTIFIKTYFGGWRQCDRCEAMFMGSSIKFPVGEIKTTKELNRIIETFIKAEEISELKNDEWEKAIKTKDDERKRNIKFNEGLKELCRVEEMIKQIKVKIEREE